MRATVLFVVGAFLAACSDERGSVRASLDVGDLLSAPADPRFERALAPREFAFPSDHGPHASFQTEWWYFTGTLADSAGREFGYQLTFFRRALAPDAPSLDSAWATKDIYMAHFTLADAQSGTFEARERFERGALGLAGASATPWRVWLRDWSVEGDLDAGDVRLRARDGELELDLALRATSALVRQGERGLSRKGAAAGNASHYYSLPRMRSQGTLALRGERHTVSGESWFDREWSTSALEEGQVGWDWFALRLDDGSELMLYRMRRADGSVDPFSSAMFTRKGAEPRALASNEFVVRESASWTSPASGASYPSRWTIEVPSLELAVELEPLVSDCELRVAVRYWEGAVRVKGTRESRALLGRGFVELTGY
ncbi:MAG: carotenoid 1,2-hydratase [Planctomycetes bacterium]|nr:carotenoid 1,2-hydratase [Planctomycetota bacterium]